MAEEHDVRILEWPKDVARLEHRFPADTSCPVAVSFAATPVSVVMTTPPERPLDINMNMRLSVRDALPLCIKLCEPICARSDYTIGITLFDRPIVSITIRGVTRLFNCNEEPR